MRTRKGSLVAALVAAALGALAPAANAATGSFQGDAFGTFANVGQYVIAGETAPIGIGCLTPANVSTQNAVATVNLPRLVQLNAIHTTGATFETSTTIGDSTSSDVADGALIGGAIKLHAATAVSTTSFAAGTGLTESSAGTNLVGLVIAGKPIAVTPAPNTTISLPGIGRVVVNEQIQTTTATSAQFTVNALHVYVTVTNLLGIKPGTQIIVGHASSGLTLTTPGVEFVSGGAYSTSLNVSGIVTAPPSWGVGIAVGLGCIPADGSQRNGAARIYIPKVITADSLTNTGTGTTDTTGTTVTASTTSTVQDLNLLSGLVKASVVEAQANGQVTPSGTTFTDTGSELVGLSIGGHKIAADVAPNTKISIAGLTVWLHRVIHTTSGIIVRMIEITGKPPNLPKSAQIVDLQVAVAHTEVP